MTMTNETTQTVLVKLAMEAWDRTTGPELTRAYEERHKLRASAWTAEARARFATAVAERMAQAAQVTALLAGEAAVTEVEAALDSEKMARYGRAMDALDDAQMARRERDAALVRAEKAEAALAALAACRPDDAVTAVAPLTAEHDTRVRVEVIVEEEEEEPAESEGSEEDVPDSGEGEEPGGCRCSERFDERAYLDGENLPIKLLPLDVQVGRLLDVLDGERTCERHGIERYRCGCANLKGM